MLCFHFLLVEITFGTFSRHWLIFMISLHYGKWTKGSKLSWSIDTLWLVPSVQYALYRIWNSKKISVGECMLSFGLTSIAIISSPIIYRQSIIDLDLEFARSAQSRFHEGHSESLPLRWHYTQWSFQPKIRTHSCFPATQWYIWLSLGWPN